jgi:hypothetical protein
MRRAPFFTLPETGESYAHEAIHRVLSYCERQRVEHSIYSGPQPDETLHRAYIEAGYVMQSALRRSVEAATLSTLNTQPKGTNTHA